MSNADKFTMPPDLGGEEKPPCFLCGEPSCGTMLVGDESQRFCEDCIVKTVAAICEDGRDVAVHQRGTSEVTIFTKGDRQ